MRASEAHSQIAREVRSAKSSFYWPMLLQARPRREALFTIYAFARVLDDIADGSQTTDEKRKALTDWREWINACFADDNPPSNDTALKVGLLDVIEKFALPFEPFLALISGMEADVEGPIVAPTWPELEVYCGQVAGAVGVLCLAIWGWRGHDANAFATATGEALQLTNILRDVADDAKVGRLYIPEEALALASITQREVQAVISEPGLSQACKFVAERARIRFAEARKLWPQDAPKSLKPAWVMMRSYEALFRKVQKTGYAFDAPRVRLSKVGKTFHIATAYLTAP